MAVDVKVVFKQYLKKYTVGVCVWTLATVACGLLILSFVSKIFFANHILAQQAFDSGQRIIIHISSGEVEGNPRHTKNEESADATPIIGKEGLAPAPLSSITEQSDKGLVPVAAKDGTLPWKYYARPYDIKEKRPLVAIVFTNLGLSKSLTEDVLKLPHNFTLGFSPYAGDAKAWTRKARESGFESLVDIPLEPEEYPLSDPGPYGLIEDLSSNETAARLHWVLSRFPGYVGVLGSADEKLTANVNAMRPALTELTARGVLFLYLKTPKNTGLADFIKSHALYALGVDTVIDAEISTSAIEKQLQDLTELAKKQGTAIGIAHSYPPTIEALAEWSGSLAAQGVELAPVSAVALRTFP